MNDCQRVNKIIKKTNSIDFRIQAYDGCNLLLVGSFDLCYYHTVEINFGEVSYISLPINFIYPIFRQASVKEINSICNLIYLEPEDIVYCIAAETSSSIKPMIFNIVARSIVIHEETVFYYNRNLNKSDRLID